ncbi:MAG: YecR family lipoprotein, partial [Ottowia sp.]
AISNQQSAISNQQSAISNFNPLKSFRSKYFNISQRQIIAGIFAFLAVGVTACSSPPQSMKAIGGSRGDGIVKMAYRYTPLNRPEISQSGSLAEAARRCRAWGYADAQAFSESEETCVRGPSFACDEYQVTLAYQCTGGQASLPVNPPTAASSH